MRKLRAETPFADTDLKDDVLKAAQQRQARTTNSPALATAKLDMSKDFAAMVWQDPPKAKVTFRDRFNEAFAAVNIDSQ